MGEGARQAWERLMEVPEGYEYQAPIHRRLIQQGKEEGLKEGKEEGLKEGKEEGLKEGLRQALREVAARRRLSFSPDESARIANCRSTETLQRWLALAAVATDASAVFAAEDS
jgi:flagellar biosynthesis/type III secretory pathway protein FliH